MDDLEALFGEKILPGLSSKSLKDTRVSLQKASRVFRYSFIDKRKMEQAFLNKKKKIITFSSTDWI